MRLSSTHVSRSWFRTLKKQQKLGEKCLQNSIVSRDGAEKVKYKNKADNKERKKTALLRNDGGKERQEEYPTYAVCFFQLQGSFLVFLFCQHFV